MKKLVPIILGVVLILSFVGATPKKTNPEQTSVSTSPRQEVPRQEGPIRKKRTRRHIKRTGSSYGKPRRQQASSIW